MKKEAILAEIQRTAEVNGGTPLGHDRFLTETGIKVSDWHGKYWVRWGDALIEAGFKPNVFRKEYEEDFLLDKIAALVIKLGHVPVKAEILIEGRADLLPTALMS